MHAQRAEADARPLAERRGLSAACTSDNSVVTPSTVTTIASDAHAGTCTHSADDHLGADDR